MKLSISDGSLHEAGVFAYALGIFCMALVDASGKYLSQGYPVSEIIFFRSLLAVLPLGIMATLQGWNTIKTRAPLLHVIRGVCVLLTLGFFIWSLRYLPLADATVLNLTSPIFTTLFAAWFLGEPVPDRYWIALLVGVVGVWLVIKPGEVTFRLASFLAVASAASYACSCIATRVLVRTDSALCCTFNSNSVMLVTAAFGVLLQNWLALSLSDAMVIFVMAISSIGLQLLTGFALKHVKASRLAPLDYTLLVWNVGIGALMWHEWPVLSGWIGMLLVCASCWLVLSRQSGNVMTARTNPELEK